jgi:hypothetical protein
MSPSRPRPCASTFVDPTAARSVGFSDRLVGVEEGSFRTTLGQQFIAENQKKG